ncbi:capsid protein [Ochrobactrum sp. MYb29]|nr:capsid protein [Ochrobactrum sp. MYb29]
MNRPFPVSATLTAVAIGYSNPSAGMIHRGVLPPVPVTSERFTWLTYPIDQAFTVPELQVGRKGRVNEVEFSAKPQEGTVKHYGLDDVIPITDIDEAKKARERKVSKYDPEGAATEGLSRLIELGREVRAARIVQKPENYDKERRIALVGEAKFSNFEKSDPFEVLNAAMTKPLVYRANTISMGQEVWEVIKRHPRLIKAVKGGMTSDGAISREQFAELMEIDPARFYVGISMENAAAKGQPVNLVKVWGNSIQLSYVDTSKASPEDNILTWGFTAEYETRIAGSLPAPEVGLKGGIRIRVGEMVEEVVCAKSLGFIIRDAV